MSINSEKAEAIIAIVGKDEISGLVQKVRGNIEGLGDATAKQASAIDVVKQSWSSVATGVSSVFKIIETVTGTLGEMYQGAREFAQEQAIDVAFRRAIPAADELLKKIDRLTGAQIRDDVVQKYATQMAIAGASAEDIAIAMQLATKASNATGTELETAIQAFADGLTKVSDKSLKSLGVNIDIKHVLEEQARQLGKSASQLSLAEERAALLRAGIREVGIAFGEVDIEGTLIQKLNHADQVLDKFKDKMKGWAAYWAEQAMIAGEIGVRGAGSMVEKAMLDSDKYFGPGVASAIGTTVAELKKLHDEQTKGARAHEAATAAREKHTAALRTHIEQQHNLRLAAGWESLELAGLAQQMNKTQLAEQYYAQAAKEFAAANWKAVESVTTLQAGVGSLWTSLQVATGAVGNFGDKAIDAFKGLLNAGVGRRKPGGGGSRPKDPGFNDDAESRRQIAAQNQTIDDKNAQAQLQRDIDFILQEGAEKLAAQQDVWAREDATNKGHKDALKSVGDMVRNSTMTSFQDANRALASGSEQYLQGLASFASGLQSEFGRIAQIIELTEEAGGTVGQAWQKAAPGMVSAIATVGAAFVKDARLKYAIEAAGALGAGLFALANPLTAGSAWGYFAAAAQYTIAAAMAGGSGSKGGGSGGGGGGGRGRGENLPSGFGPPSSQQQKAPDINYNFYGTVVGDDASAKRALARMVREGSRYIDRPGHAT